MSNTALPVRMLTASESGAATARLLLKGKITTSQAGDMWLLYADRSYSEGCTFMRAYLAAGGTTD